MEFHFASLAENDPVRHSIDWHLLTSRQAQVLCKYVNYPSTCILWSLEGFSFLLAIISPILASRRFHEMKINFEGSKESL